MFQKTIVRGIQRWLGGEEHVLLWLEDLSSIPSTHVRQLTATPNSSSQGNFRPLASAGTCTHMNIPTDIQTRIHIILK